MVQLSAVWAIVQQGEGEGAAVDHLSAEDLGAVIAKAQRLRFVKYLSANGAAQSESGSRRRSSAASEGHR